MKDYITKTIIYITSAGMLVCVGIIIGLNIKLSSLKPKYVALVGHRWMMEEDYEGEIINDNFWRFVDASYILVGTPPDCQFYKIVSEVPRHSYDVESFYAEDGDVIYYHDENGGKASTVAIDLSTFQTDIDWDMVKASGVEVVMVRVGFRGYGSGKIVLDDMFEEHTDNAIKAGLKVGVYFFSQAVNYDEGVEEARFALDAIRKYRITGPVAIDTEYIDAEDARTADLSIDDRTDGVVGFCETVKQAGYTPMIYASRNWFVQSLDMTRLGDYKLWLAHYTNQTDFPYLYTGWQYTDAGEIPGIYGSVDLNVWFD